MNYEEFLEFRQKASRFNAINLMRQKRLMSQLIWNKFKLHSWKLIEEITEDERIKYSDFIKQ